MKEEAYLIKHTPSLKKNLKKTIITIKRHFLKSSYTIPSQISSILSIKEMSLTSMKNFCLKFV